MKMIEVLNMVKKDVADQDYKVNGKTVRTNLELTTRT